MNTEVGFNSLIEKYLQLMEQTVEAYVGDYIDLKTRDEILAKCYESLNDIYKIQQGEIP